MSRRRPLSIFTIRQKVKRGVWSAERAAPELCARGWHPTMALTLTKLWERE